MLRYTAPELISDTPISGHVNDIWMLGCLIVETFSKYKVWDGYTETEIIKQLKNLTPPKIPNDIPQLLWGLTCECLNPFYEARIDVKDVLSKLYVILSKHPNLDLQQRLISKTKIFIFPRPPRPFWSSSYI